MRWWSELLYLLRRLDRRRAERELEEEIRTHLELEIEQNLQDGMSEEEARRAALRVFGNVTIAKEETRAMWGLRWVEVLGSDLQYATRVLRKNPGFASVAVMTLALSIGATSAIFSVVSAVVFRPLPYENADRLVVISGRLGVKGLENLGASPPEFMDYRDRSQLLERIAAYATTSYNLKGASEPERVTATLASAGLFPLLGVQPVVGRTFLPEEDQDGRDNVVVISHGQWSRHFGSDPDVIGRTLTLNGKNFTIIGVMPARFELPDQSTDVWLPIAFSPGQVSESERGSHWLKVIGQLKPGVTLEQARAEMEAIAQQMQQQHPEIYPEDDGWGVSVTSQHESLVGAVRTTLYVLLGAVGFVLLIACANVANLQLARAASRQKEVAIRAALGASRTRLIRQMLTESLLLSFLGGTIGLLIAMAGKNLLIALGPADVPRLKEVTLDSTVLVFSFAISALAGVLSGLVPALQSSKINLVESLKEARKNATESAGGHRTRNLLAISEMALALVLLIGAGLMIKSLIRLQEVNPGFNPENVLTMRVTLPQTSYPQASKQRAFYGQILEKVRALPGVQSASAVNFLPLSSMGNQRNFVIKGRGEMKINLEFRMVDPDYFRAMEIPVVAGRALSDQDREGTQRVAVINETFARLFFPDQDPLGNQVKLHGESSPFPWLSVVGVIRDVKHGGLDVDARPEMYVSYLQPLLPNFAVQSMFLVVRSANNPESLASAARKEVLSLDKDLPVYRVATLEQLLSASVASRRFNMLLLQVFAAVALALAVIGIYGLLSYSVSRRTHEIGIRMAVGAEGSDIVKLIIRQALPLVGAGVAIGLIGSYTLTRFMSSLLFGVSATDPVTFTGISILLSAVALLASYIPARRAMKVDPMKALRYE